MFYLIHKLLAVYCISVNSKDSKSLVEEMQKADIDARIVGKVTNLNKYKINVM